MLHERRLRRYQKFLKTLRRPESTLCSCPSHLHPRPWVPPPCRTTRSYGEEDSLYRRSHSNPDLLTHSRHPIRMDRSYQSWESEDDDQHPKKSIQHLYSDARVLKEAFTKISKGDLLSKDMRNTVKKWSKKSLPEQDDRLKKSRREKQTYTNHGQHAEEEDNRGPAELNKEEEALRHELRNLRELAQSRAALKEENKRLMRKVHRLRQRVKRQEATQRGSRESIGAEQGTGTREEFVILSLKKKYEDLLHYVLKVESENQKLKSLTGMSGEHEEYFNGSDCEDIAYGPRVVARLESELEALRGEIMKKDDYILECERHIQTLKENIALHESLRNQKASARNIDTATLEEEWMRRLTETREMYDRAIQGYKDQLAELQEKLLNFEQLHAKQVQELMERLTRAQDEVISARTNKVGIIRPPDANETHGEQESYKNGQNIERQISDKAEQSDRPSSVGSDRQGHENSESLSRNIEETEGQQEMAGARGADEKVPEKSSDKTKETRNMNDDDPTTGNSEKADHASSTAKVHEKDCVSISGTPVVIAGFERYSETLETLVKRLEISSVGGDDLGTTVSVVKDTISRCLQEWKESFQQVDTQHRDDADSLKKENLDLKKDTQDLRKDYEDLQRKLRGKNKKIESLQNQCKELEQQNMKLLHQCSQLESQMGASQITSQLDVLQGLPKTLQETEQHLLDTRELLQQAQGEKQTLQDQVQVQGEKLIKKENKLKAEREQGATREKEIASLKDTISSLHRQLEEVSRETSHLQEQLSTKDTILEHTSAQLEERIRECASLSSLVDRYKVQQNQESDRIQAQLNERESASHKQYVEAQALAARYQAQLSALRSEKDQNEKSLRSQVRKLEEQLDQLQLRNSTLQRQLSTITSTYHNMFSAVDLNLPSPSVPGGSNVKGS